jgi:hypothetical protein
MPNKGKKIRVYSTKEKQEVWDAIAKGMGISEIHQLTGIPYGTIFSWKTGRSSATTEKHKCPDCGRVFPTGKSLGGHTRVHHPKYHNIDGVNSVLHPELGKHLAKPTPAPINQPVLHQMSLDDFCDMMIQALREREMWKSKYHDLEKSVEKWRDTAGKLNEALQNSGKF